MKANDGRVNLILLDSAPQPEWNFAALMEAETGEKWNIWHIDSHFSDSAWKKKAKFFLFPLKVLRHRKEFGTILSYQQFYGLFFAFYSAIFHLKKHCHLIVTTFIYRPKQGWKGKLYAWFMRKAVNSPALDKIVCFSSSEPAYYQSIFGTDKFTYVPLGLGDLNRGGYIPQGEERFILAAGKSNRDYDFLVDALKDTPYQVRILSDAYNHPNPGSNIRIYHDVFGEKYYQMLSECCCVIVPLADARISAGQLVFLQAMMFAKPIITTESDTVRDYIESGKNGLIIPKQRDALRDAVRRLYEDEALYRGMAKGAKYLDKDINVYTLLGDGEIEEGQVWEAMMFASQYKLDNLCVIVDVNGLQIDGKCEDVMNAEPIDKKMEAFGLNVIKINGNDFDELEKAFNAFHENIGSGKPFGIIMKTVKGLGVSYMENQVGWHGKAPNDAEYEIAMNELKAKLAEIEEA